MLGSTDYNICRRKNNRKKKDKTKTAKTAWLAQHSSQEKEAIFHFPFATWVFSPLASSTTAPATTLVHGHGHLQENSAEVNYIIILSL